MPDSNALTDVTTVSNQTTSTSSEQTSAAATTASATTTTNVDGEAAEIGRIMLESGYTKQNVADLLQAPQNLTNLTYLLNNNPQEFWNLVQRNNPSAFEQHENYITEQFVKKYPPKTGEDKGAQGKTEAAPELMAEVESLRAEVAQARTAQERRDAAAAMAQVQARYNARVDDLFTTLPKELSLTKTDKASLRALLNQELAADPVAVQRVSQGNFVDVPRRFQQIIEGLSTDRKAAAEADKAAREQSKKASFADLSLGANPFMVDVPSKATESWDATESAFAEALGRTA